MAPHRGCDRQLAGGAGQWPGARARAVVNPPNTPTPTACFGAGTASTPPVQPEHCRSASDWKQEAYDSCTAQKTVLVDLQLSLPCGGDLYAGMSYQCCTSPPQPPVTDPGPTTPPPPVPACFVGLLDDSPVCVAPDVMKGRASEICASKDFRLTNLGLFGACSDGTSFVGAKYECCAPVPTTPGPGPGPVPPPPSVPTPPGGCRSASEGGDSSCKDSATWRKYAAENCASTGMRLAKFQTRESCGTDLYRWSDYACCTP